MHLILRFFDSTVLIIEDLSCSNCFLYDAFVVRKILVFQSTLAYLKGKLPVINITSMILADCTI
jgi:hypothetical protein